MSSFDVASDLPQDPAYRLLMNSPVLMFHQPDVLTLTTEWLTGAAYQLVEFDASTWKELGDLHDQLSTALDFPGYYGRNFDALRDCLRDVAEHDYGWDPKSTGLVLIVRHFDAFVSTHPDVAQLLLNIVADASRTALLVGGRFLCLVQSDDPRLALAPVGAMPVEWNPAEWQERARVGKLGS